MEKCDHVSPVDTTLRIISGRWKFLVVYELSYGIKRFGELRKALPGITQKMLTQTLREMEQYGIITRTVYPQVPPKVEYALTSIGETLRPILDEMCNWGSMYMLEMGITCVSDLEKEKQEEA
jgi:DNA-binding HxlR family transcriptional regulator